MYSSHPLHLSEPFMIWLIYSFPIITLFTFLQNILFSLKISDILLIHSALTFFFSLFTTHFVVPLYSSLISFNLFCNRLSYSSVFRTIFLIFQFHHSSLFLSSLKNRFTAYIFPAQLLTVDLKFFHHSFIPSVCLISIFIFSSSFSCYGLLRDSPL